MTKEEFIESIKLDGENWKDVVGWEGCYIVSDYGRVASVREFYYSYMGDLVVKKRCFPRVCKTYAPANGMYEKITLISRPRKRTYLIHKLVADAFIPNPHNYPCIDHIDDNPLNNRADNLQWCTYRMNCNKPHHRDALSRAFKGVPTGRGRIVLRLKNSRVVGCYNSLSELLKYGYSPYAVTQVCRGVFKQHHGFQWMFLEDYEKKK